MRTKRWKDSPAFTNGSFGFRNIARICTTTSRSTNIFVDVDSLRFLRGMLRYMLDENEFLSAHGIRSVSKFHENHPYEFGANGAVHRVNYVPGESNTGLFGGNSNWRGPIWFPLNYLLVEALER